MKALWSTLNNSLIKDIDEPIIQKPSEVKIKVKTCGLCGSDMHKLFHDWPKNQVPILGHEIAGDIVEKGTEVTNFKIGDKVAVNPILPCYKCSSCLANLGQFCSNIQAVGKNKQGGFAEYICVDEKQILKLHENISYSEATLLDGIAVGLHTLDKLKIKEQAKMILVGDGSLAMIITLLVIEKGIKEICFVGKHKFRLEHIKQYGQNIKTIHFDNSTNILKNEFDVGIEVVGGRQSGSLKLLVDSLKPVSKIGVVGVFDPVYVYQYPIREFFFKELELIGVNSYSLKSPQKSDFSRALGMLTDGSINLKKMITHEIPLTDFAKVKDILSQKQIHQPIKIVITN